MFNIVALAITLLLCSLAQSGDKPSANPWFTSLYRGQFSNKTLIDNLQFDHDFESSHVYVASMGKEVWRYKERIAFEVEGQVGSHTGKQDNQEINLALTLRFLPFFWDPIVDTSFAFGNGLSYAIQTPALEEKVTGGERTSQVLYYILVEWAFSLPNHPQWDLFWRIHHRSGVYGRLADEDAISNFVGVGLRYRFTGGR
jgi:hypothetical protein